MAALREGACRANLAHTRQSKPDSGRAFKINVLEPFKVVPSSLVDAGLASAFENQGASRERERAGEGGRERQRERQRERE